MTGPWAEEAPMWMARRSHECRGERGEGEETVNGMAEPDSGAEGKPPSRPRERGPSSHRPDA